MAVRPRQNRWVVDFFIPQPDGRRVRFRRTLGAEITSRRQAEQEEIRLRAEVELQRRASLSRHEEPPAAAFSGFAKLWFDTHVKVNLKPTVQDRYETIIRFHLVPFFGDRAITGITHLDIEQFKAANVQSLVGNTEKKIAPKTVNEHLCVLSSMFSSAVKWGYLKTNPCIGVPRLRLPAQEFQFYDRKQTEVFLSKAAAIEPDYYAFFATAFKTGLRLGELLGLEWGDIDFVSGTIHVQRSHSEGHTTTPKSGKPRIVPMTPSLVYILNEHRHLKGNLVFCRPNGSHLTRDIVKHPFERVARLAGLHRIRIHDTRHSFASQLVMAGAPLKAVADLLGHAETRVTERYAHLAHPVLQAYVDLLDGRPIMSRGQAAC